MEATELGLTTVHVPGTVDFDAIVGERYYHRRNFGVAEIKQMVTSHPDSDVPSYVICKFSGLEVNPYASAVFIDDFFRDWAPLGVGRVIGLDGERQPSIDDHGTGDVILKLSDTIEAGELSASIRVSNDRGYWTPKLEVVPFRKLVLHPCLDHSIQAGQILRIGDVSFIAADGDYYRMPRI